MRLVTDDIFGLMETLTRLQTLLAASESWSLRNGLKCNTIKSQVLHLQPTIAEQNLEVKLDGAQLNFLDVVEYLALQLTRDVFTGKDIVELTAKYTGAIQLMINEQWFTLALQPKYIARSYHTYVCSVILYSYKLLKNKDRKLVYDLDNEMIDMMLGKLLKLGRGKLA